MQGPVSSMFPRKRLSLTIRISALLIAAVILPLFVTVVSSELVLRPTLMSQAIAEMKNDAQSHVQAIDALFIAREEDQEALGQFFAVQQFLAGTPGYFAQAKKELQLGYSLDANYSAWTLFAPNGTTLLSYPANPTKRGSVTIPPEISAQLQHANQKVISDVYFDPNSNMAFVDIYTSIASAQGTVVGILRSTLLLNEIWTAVNNETNAATGSYALILDAHGVRIAYTNGDTTLATLPPILFKATAPLSAQFRQQIQSEGLYGGGVNGAVSTTKDFDQALAAQQHNTQIAYQITPVEQTQAFQAYQVSFQSVPWTYVVLRPVNTITGAASQQDLSLLIIAVVITLLAAVVGIWMGRNMTRPVLSSVTSLTQSSEQLKVFSAREQTRAKEQKWIVESAQTGLEAVQYYTQATVTGAEKLREIGQNLAQRWARLDDLQKQRAVREMMAATDYLQKAAAQGVRSSKGLITAIRVTHQVGDQLLSGAVSASEASAQLEEVIAQLRQLVGE